MGRSLTSNSSESVVYESHDAVPIYEEGQINNLERRSTNGSVLSKILSSIKADQDEEYEAKTNMPIAEDAINESVHRVSREYTRQSHDKETDKESLTDASVEEESSDHPVDGLFAIWQAVLAMLLGFSTWGANAAFGVFLNYYLNNSTFPGATHYDFALIGGIVVFLAQILSPVSCFLVNMFGQTPVLISGLALQTIGYILGSFCTKLWQIYCCQGLLVGASFSLTYIPGTLVIPTWFQRRKSTAMGICVSGAGLGGLIFTLSLNKLIEQTGDQRWPLRMVGCITFTTTTFSILFLRARNKKSIEFNFSKIDRERFHAIFKIVFRGSLYKSIHFVLVGCFYGLCLMSYTVCLYSYSPYATSIGLSANQANNLLAILNAAQVAFRPCVGLLADNYGRNNATSLFCVYLAILILAFWRNAASYGAIIVLSIMLGGPMGVGSIMAQSLAADILDVHGTPELMPAAWAALNLITSIFVLPCEVIAIALKDSTISNPYDHAQVFTGCMFLLATVLIFFNREWLVRKKFESRRTEAQAKGYLKASDLQEAEEEEHPNKRVERYDRLLQPTVINYFIRMFYPIRV